MNHIVKKIEIAPRIFLFEIAAADIAKNAKPGQFIILMPCLNGEKIPLTISEINAEKQTITIIFQTVGKSTLQLASLKKGGCIPSLVGPLGKPSEIQPTETIIGIGGGTGIAVLYPILKANKSIGNKITTIIGAKSQNLLILSEKIKTVSDKTIFCTDDGSCGEKGFVTDVLEKILSSEKSVDKIIAIGPLIMMKNICKKTRPRKIKTIVSLPSIMVDGTGMCGACRLSFDNEIKFCCVDGPEFDGHKIDWEELIIRQNMYRQQEAEALAYWLKQGGCNGCKRQK